MSPRHVSRPVAELTRLTEKQYQAQIEDLAHTLGYATWHNTYAIGSDRGWPDLILVRAKGTHGTGRAQGRIVFAELKGPRGSVSLEQQEWLDHLKAAGGEVYLWFSEKNSLQEIADILAT